MGDLTKLAQPQRHPRKRITQKVKRCRNKERRSNIPMPIIPILTKNIPQPTNRHRQLEQRTTILQPILVGKQPSKRVEVIPQQICLFPPILWAETLTLEKVKSFLGCRRHNRQRLRQQRQATEEATVCDTTQFVLPTTVRIVNRHLIPLNLLKRPLCRRKAQR